MQKVNVADTCHDRWAEEEYIRKKGERRWKEVIEFSSVGEEWVNKLQWMKTGEKEEEKHE